MALMLGQSRDMLCNKNCMTKMKKCTIKMYDEHTLGRHFDFLH